MKKKSNYIDSYKRTKRSSILVFLVLKTLVILCMILQLIHGDLENAFICFLSLILLLMPSIIQRKLEITFPNTLEIIIYLFIFASEILGEINNFYETIPYWDTILHTINGFLCAAIGFSLINILNNTSDYFNLSPLYLCITAFCFSMTIGVLWEFFEFSVDKNLKLDMQKDKIVNVISSVKLDSKKENNAIIINNIDKTILYDKNKNELMTIEGGYLDIGINDTMKDLFVNFIGAIFFCGFGGLYLINKKNQLILNFIPIKGKRNF